MTPRRTFVITGAGSDIGAALARYLGAFEDIDLVLVTRNTPPPSLASRHIVLRKIDLLDTASLETVARAVADHTSGPFTVVHCVGDFWIHKPLVHTAESEIVRMISSHYVTLALTVQALLPLLMKHHGRIVAFSCNSVLYNYPDMAPFTSAKAAVEAFIKCIANEYSEFGIVANTLALPTIRTQKVEELKANGDRQNYVTPAELSALIADTIAAAPSSLNGNTLKVFKHSPSFFHDSYFDRNPRKRKIEPA